MTVKPADAVAGFDSASTMLEATAHGLRGEPFDRAGRGPAFGAALHVANLLPRPLRQKAYAVVGGAEGLPPDELGEVDIDEVSEWVTGHYGPGQFPAVLLGSSNGAAVHLATALGAPWLPQTLLIPVHWTGNDPARPDRALEFGAENAPKLLRRNPDIALHHMHDANQDHLMIQRMAYFRIKRCRLGPAYEQFIRTRLAPGAPIIVLADESTWPVTTVGERHVFQVGAQGGIGPEDYDRHGLVPDTHAPEAEWGFESLLLEDITHLAATTGHPVHVIQYPDPHALSGPVADIHRTWLNSDRLLIESFLLLDPTRTREAGLVPLWTMFPVRSAVETAAEYMSSRDFESVHIGLFPHGVRSRGIAEPQLWREKLGHDVQFLGLNERRYPADFAALTRYSTHLRHIPRPNHPAPAPGTLPLPQVLTTLARQQ
jgi:hypothetical protein